jgi:hypothetical protein
MLVYGSFKVSWKIQDRHGHKLQLPSLLSHVISQNIRRYVVSWIFVVGLIVVVQLMVLFDVIHVVNTRSNESSDKSFLWTALEVFCLGKCACHLLCEREEERDG